MSNNLLEKNNTQVLQAIEDTLQIAFKPLSLKIMDESAAHIGHAEATATKMHISILIQSSSFSKQSLIDRHRKVYEVLHDFMPRLHAIRLDLHSPEESLLD
jgi:BolA family transcriptional regulator, general stress-responsive regulator